MPAQDTDPEGPRIRIGELEGHRLVSLKKMQVVCFRTGAFRGAGNVIPLDYGGPEMAQGTHCAEKSPGIAVSSRQWEEKSIPVRIEIGWRVRAGRGALWFHAAQIPACAAE